MACIKGKSICETCGVEFTWRRHDSQPTARFCNRKCTNKDLGIKGNKNRIFWSSATEEQKKERLKNFFENKVVKKQGCWEWNGYVDKNGYPQVHYHNGKRNTNYKAHRLSYEIYKGEILNGYKVCHTCDNPTCTNPDHLWLGTPKENSLDAKKKGRYQKGEDRHNAKLFEKDVKKIKKMLVLGITQTRIAKEYNVHIMTINSIAKCRNWKHVK